MASAHPISPGLDGSHGPKIRPTASGSIRRGLLLWTTFKFREVLLQDGPELGGAVGRGKYCMLK